MHRGLQWRPAAGLYNGGLHERNDTTSQNFKIKVSTARVPELYAKRKKKTERGKIPEKEAVWTRSNQNHTPCDFCITTSPTSRGIEQNAWPWLRLDPWIHGDVNILQLQLLLRRNPFVLLFALPLALAFFAVSSFLIWTFKYRFNFVAGDRTLR